MNFLQSAFLFYPVWFTNQRTELNTLMLQAGEESLNFNDHIAGRHRSHTNFQGPPTDLQGPHTSLKTYYSTSRFTWTSHNLQAPPHRFTSIPCNFTYDKDLPRTFNETIRSIIRLFGEAGIPFIWIRTLGVWVLCCAAPFRLFRNFKKISQILSLVCNL